MAQPPASPDAPLRQGLPVAGGVQPSGGGDGYDLLPSDLTGLRAALRGQDGASPPKPGASAPVLRQAATLLALGCALLCIGLFLAPPGLALLFFAAASALVALGLLLPGMAWVQARQARHGLQRTLALVAQDPAPCFCTDPAGVVLGQNPASRAQFGDRRGQDMARALDGVMPHAAAFVTRHEGALDRGRLAQDVVQTRKGAVRITALPRGGGALWRLDEMGDPGPRTGSGIALPMLVASPTGTILSMNAAMRGFLGHRARSLAQIFGDGGVVPGKACRLDTVEGPKSALVLDIPASDGRHEIYLLPEDAVAPPPDDSVAARAFEALPVALLHIGADGRILASNHHAQALVGLAPGDRLRLAELVEGLGRPVDDWLRDTLEDRIPNRPEVVRTRRREQDCFIQITLGRIASGAGPSLLAVLHDATELKTLEQQFVQSQKMQAIGELAGGVAHDFNNLLTAISGHCDLLLLRHDPGDADYGDLMQITQNANRAAGLVGQLLAFSRKQTLQPEYLDLRDTMGDLTHLLNRLVGEKIRLELSHDPGLLPIRADRRQLDQVLMNLVVNARDAMPEGGTVRIETRVLDLGEPLVRDNAVVPVGRYVTIAVSDTGTGIAPDKLPRIFEPFFTTKRTGEGTGLGLSMAYGIIKQTGGYIFADSILGQGACFTIYYPAHDKLSPQLLPDPVPAMARIAPAPRLADMGLVDALPDPAPPPRRGSPGAEPRARRLTLEGARAARPEIMAPPADAGVILLVEDEAPVRAFASRALRLRGYTVIEAANAEEALERLRDKSLSVDLFVTDVVMPGMDGPSWVRQALKDRPGVKVVFVSGYAEDAFETSNPEIPNSVFLPKPFSLSDLTQTVRRQIH